MGKPTGFLDYERVEATAVSPKERIKNFNEFHTPLWRAILPVWYDNKGND